MLFVACEFEQVAGIAAEDGGVADCAVGVADAALFLFGVALAGDAQQTRGGGLRQAQLVTDAGESGHWGASDSGVSNTSCHEQDNAFAYRIAMRIVFTPFLQA